MSRNKEAGLQAGAEQVLVASMNWVANLMGNPCTLRKERVAKALTQVMLLTNQVRRRERS